MTVIYESPLLVLGVHRSTICRDMAKLQRCELALHANDHAKHGEFGPARATQR